MKKSLLFVATAVILISYTSCKDVVEDVIDCTVESAFLKVEASIDDTNPLLVHFTFINGDTINNTFTLDQSIKWEFGDGAEETSDGLTISHQYPDIATYDTKGYYMLRRGSATCSDYKEKSVTLE